MKVVETFLCGKSNKPELCEDGIFASDHIVAIIDGVTSKGTRLWNAKSSGLFAKDILLDYFTTNSLSGMTAIEIFSQLDKVISDAVTASGEDIPTEDYPRAVVIIYNDYTHEIWNYGDCQCRINDTVHSHRKKVDQINETLRAEVLEEQIKQGYSIEELLLNDVGRAAIQENLLQQFAYENQLVDLGYPVLNGQGIAPEFIQIYPVHEGDSIILASDGYPQIQDSLEESERALARILKNDPLCFRDYRATKGIQPGNVSFDDRAFCRISMDTE